MSLDVTDPFDDFDFDDDDGAEVVAGREPPPWTQAPDWVSYADIEGLARFLHTVLKSHLNQKRGDKVAKPGTRSLAKILGLSRRDKVSPLLKQLVGIQAIEIKKVGMPARNIYVVHTMPPEGYEGPLTGAEWYRRNREQMKAEAAADKVKRDARRERAKARTGSTSTEVVAVTPDVGQQQPVTPDTGQQVASPGGHLVTPPAGREQDEEEQHEVEQDSVPPSEVRPPTPDSNSDDVPVQSALVGEDKPLASKEPTFCDRAYGIANGWIAYRKEQGAPISGARVQAKLKSLIKPALEAGYSDAEVKWALADIGRGIPTDDALDDALLRRRTGQSVGRRRTNGTGPMAGTNLHIDDLPAEQRAAQNPFAVAARSSDVARRAVSA